MSKALGFDEFIAIRPAPKYLVSESRAKAWEAIQRTDGLTTLLKLETGELHTVEGRAEIIGVYLPSVSPHQFRSDTE